MKQGVKNGGATAVNKDDDDDDEEEEEEDADMGNSESGNNQRANEIRSTAATTPLSGGGTTSSSVTVGTIAVTKLPMPDCDELERRFAKVLNSMDLPPDKAKLLKQYDDEKKWDLICDQERVHAKESPLFYINKLKTYLDPKASRSSRKRKMMGDSTSTQVLRDLEISLRTNHIEWVREFLNKENQGLDILIDYLSFRQVIMRHEQIISKSLQRSMDNMATMANETINTRTSRRAALEADNPRMRRASKHIQKLKMGEAKDDIHVSIMCLRAIMNNKHGFNMVFEHTQAINCIALSLNHKRLRTKALVLELLAAICLVKGGHEIILNAFNNFKEVCSETRRFETLMGYFMNYEVFDIDFMVACMQFINIVVHSVEDMNFRVHLQYEFTQLGLDDYLERFRYTESEELQVQISAYLDNVFDVAALMEDSETKSAALENVADLEEQLSHAHERMQDMENEFMARIVELENQMQSIADERDHLQELHRVVNEEYHTLKKRVDDKEEESRHRESLLETKIQELEKMSQLPNGSLSTTIVSSTIAVPPPPPLPPPAKKISGPPAPPPPPMMGRGFSAPPPPPPGMMVAPGDAMTIKRRVQTKYKLPTLNWIALKPNQVKGTVFNELDDDKLYNIIDFVKFEEQFKIGHVGANPDVDYDSLHSFGSKRFKKPELVTLLEHNRLRNMAISRRKMDMPIDQVLRSINSLDLKTLPLEHVEVLLRMVPSDQEVKLYREYERERKPLDVLTDEDKFLLQLCKVERLSQKLNIMSYMGNFLENIQLITPQVHAIIGASRSIKNSKKIRKLLEIILAFGNYLNSSKRGPAYGFKLQTLEMLSEMKSCDKRMTLMNYIVETVHTKFSDVINFDSDLRFIEKASTVSLENVMADVHELEKGMDLAKKEYDLRKEFRDTLVLKDFLSGAEDKLCKLQSDAKIAQDAFADVVGYFGESPRTLSATTFFSTFFRFTRTFKQAELENETRRKQELAAREASNQLPASSVVEKNKINRKNHQDAVINELKCRTRQVKDKQLLKQDEVYNGALEDILLGLKNEPYRRADAVRRSQRRRQENVRLSRTMDELEV